MTNEEREKKFQELLAKQEVGVYITFDGQNCNDYLEHDQEPCQGWDGIQLRCQCSNRRVSWALSDCGTYIYPEAW